MSKREERLNEILRDEIGKLFLRELDFPKNILITVAKVRISADFSSAKAYISVMPEKFSEIVLGVIKKKTSYLQGMINKIVNIKKTPKIVFTEEKTLEKAARIDELINQIGSRKK